MIANRRDQAKRTVCIEALNEAKDDLLTSCGQFGTIKSVSPHGVETTKYFLFEYSSIGEAEALIAATEHDADIADGQIPLRSRFLTFKPSLSMASKQSSKRPTNPHFANPKQKFAEDRFQPGRTAVDRYAALKTKKTRDEQLELLFETRRLSDLSSRLRFLTALQIEEVVASVFANVRVLPFGSSVNGFGRLESDLDMMLAPLQPAHAPSNLYFPQSKHNRQLEARDHARKTLYPLQVIMQQWVPGIDKLQLISGARIPIIGFEHRITNLECDLTTANP